ncbi:DNA replication/repair protein RecF [Methylobrevis sp. L22]|uniref:DNA replication and repair protein RecF n=2 Tax=Methylobrevis albus TaxID=2793297 RepID=A0A931I2P3_9HYPH|nr:DNA replication/repair protein RecF [Methylobrevis albus]
METGRDGAGPALRVAIDHLRLSDFRNYAALDLEAGGRSVVLVGENGAGKTNLIEAVSYLSPGRGLRRAPFRDVARIGGAGGFAVAARLDGALGTVRLGTGIEPGDSLRQVRVDGVAAKGSDVLADHLRLVWLTPAMDGLFTGPAGDRRRFLDRMAMTLDPAHGRRVVAFEKALTERNRLLEDFRSDPAWLDAVEEQVAGFAVAVAAGRRETVAAIARVLADAAADDGDGPFPVAAVRLDGAFEAAFDTASATDVEDWYRRDLAAGRSRDRAAGRALAGPHRAELLVAHSAKQMPAALSSTGEQKGLLIGLVLAQARLVAEVTGTTPVLLLDEVTAHLDPLRRAALYDRLERLGGQWFMTGTDAAAFAELGDRAAVFEARGGRLVPLGEGDPAA